MSTYTAAQKKALDKLTDELRQAAGGTYAYFEERRKKLVGQSKQKLVKILQHLKQDAPVGTLKDLTLALYNYFNGRPSADATTVAADCCPESPESPQPVTSSERRPRAWLMTERPCRPRRQRSRSPESRGRDRSRSRDRTDRRLDRSASDHTASSQPNLEEMKKDITFMKQAEMERQKAKAEADAEAAQPYRVTRASQWAAARMRDGAAALFNRTRNCAAAARQAIVQTAEGAGERAGEIADNAMDTGGNVALVLCAAKVVDAVVSNRFSPQTRDTSNMIMGAAAACAAVRQVNKYMQVEPALN